MENTQGMSFEKTTLLHHHKDARLGDTFWGVTEDKGGDYLSFSKSALENGAVGFHLKKQPHVSPAKYEVFEEVEVLLH